MSNSSRRSLWVALAWSLGLHAVLLWGWIDSVPESAETPVAVMRVDVTARKAAEVRRTPDKVGRAPTAIAPLPPTPPNSQHDRPARLEQTEVLAPAPTTGSREAEKQTEDVRGSTAAAASMSTSVEGVPLTRQVVNADELRQYRMALASAARRFKRYPPLARDRGWEGTVELALHLGPRIPVPEVVLVKSCGYAVLDEQAMTMMAQAARQTPLPDALRGRSLRVSMPVRFSLDEE